MTDIRQFTPNEKLRRDVTAACAHLVEAAEEYHATRTHLPKDYVDGVAMGYTLALDVIHKFTSGEFGKPADFFPEAS